MQSSSARERLLDTADRMFYEQGIHAVGIDTIISESSVAKTTLYSHFRSKDHLVAAYLQRRSERWCEHLEAGIAALGGPAQARILRVFELLGEWFGESGYRGCPFINACAEFAADDHPAVLVTRQHRARLRATLGRLSIEAQVVSPEALADQLLLLYDGAMVTAHLEHTTAAAQNARTAAAALLNLAGARSS